MSKKVHLEDLKGKLIVSCQASVGDALYGSETMCKMAIAARDGGASGIRANSPEDVALICSKVDLPVIGLWKRHYPDSEVYITPTYADVESMAQAGAQIVALDATLRPRPNGETLEEIVKKIRQNYSCLLMADVSTLEEGIHAYKLGFDIVSTTLSGYTPYSVQSEDPDIALVGELTKRIPIPVFAEGRIQTLEQVERLLENGAFSVVIGSTITRPHVITKRFVDKMDQMKAEIKRLENELAK
ncbi:putative N-acetylmannosamine-6-phosphate 2-epimerase [Paenibacillus psychroresistens]|uniref:Putative N-acetylmannosamine-6-phosphate 2-epimerase n=1 Tax=Paenibacillus psychroresistens TaxID=1778678 RepID=A0A6B8RBF2_9BACL|nr:N-acetylmannosamine-6-phosphate 2-epimerase [Paenibacillus psychroresistens]QGQ93911.1 putative N-acetylmannosamine-6-phosphate 2-epimerase [Paenibacillus psychroresistens]